MVDNPRRAVWVLTERGRGATEEEVNAVRQRRRAEAARKRKAKISRAENGEIEDLEDAPASEELEQFAGDHWQNELLDIIRAMEAAAFERLARQLLLNLGFSHVEVVGKSGDGGIDLLGVVKINDVLTFRVLAQCKRYKGTVAPKDIRDFRGAMQGGTDKGIYITSGRYSRDARKEASRDGVPEIDLVDGEGLANLLKRLQMGVETKLVERVIVHNDFFSKI
jgi:restriction system protein